MELGKQDSMDESVRWSSGSHSSVVDHWWLIFFPLCDTNCNYLWFDYHIGYYHQKSKVSNIISVTMVFSSSI